MPSLSSPASRNSQGRLPNKVPHNIFELEGVSLTGQLNQILDVTTVIDLITENKIVISKN